MALEPQSQAMVDALNASGVLPFRQGDAISVRERILSLRVPGPVAPDLEMHSVNEETITTPDGNFRVRILTPRQTSEALPVVIYYHGGGFFAGGLDETDELARKIAKRADVVVVNVDYHLSPEAKFPVAVNDAYAALRWVAENAERLGTDANRIILAGDSAGGNLTIVTCLQARERGGPRIALQVPIYPSLDMRRRTDYESRARLGVGGLVLDNADIDWMLDHYLSSDDQAQDWRASPILARDFSGLPPALVITADHDPLVDEGKLYADRLAKAGVPVEYACFEGTFHGFVGYAALIEIGARAVNLICDRIERVMRKPAGLHTETPETAIGDQGETL
ncbi:alpha/beta hydrolase [Sphingomonas bacterium]|uniref:alpha/beta hydrolase n=1 Tax=Sphingomonas bacterium TaxID=1895847 RepID=UPI001575CCEE|nr:alpha/beta hydrolase [Sphingomonas bacterium]